MARKYTYSRTLNSVEGQEVFTAHEFDSFDEAQNAVEKGLHNRKIQLAQRYPGAVLGGSTTGTSLTPPGVQKAPTPTSGPAATGGSTSGATAKE